MPFAVAAAVGAVVAAAAPVGALIAGASIGLTGALTIVAAAGAVTAAVGKVTGNKDLMKWGGIVGAVGGIGALASSAGLFGTAAANGGWFNSASMVKDTVNITPQVFGSNPGGLINNLGVTAPLTGVSTSALPPVAGQPAAPGAPGAAGAAPKGAVDAIAGKGAVGATAAAPPPAPPSAVPAAAPNVTGAPSVAAPGAPAPAAPSVWDDFWAYTKTPGGSMMTAAGIQSLGSFIGGAFDPAIAAQAELNRLQLQNLQAPVPVARNPGVVVTGRPAPVSGGIINQPSTGAQVTGTVQ